jgi:hypothetical protein
MRIWERDRLGRPGWRLARQSAPDSALDRLVSTARGKSFRRDARAPQSIFVVNPIFSKSFALAVPIMCGIVWPCVTTQKAWRGRAAAKNEWAAKDHRDHKK